MAFLAQTSFNSGELTPWLDARTDVDKYGRGCRRLQNMLVTPYGGVRRRPGTIYIAPAKTSSTASRLWGFNFSATQAYVIELSALRMRFFTAGNRVGVGSPAAWSSSSVSYTAGDSVTYAAKKYVCIQTHVSSAGTRPDLPGGAAYWHQLEDDILELPTPYAAADLFALCLTQVNDVVYVTHRSYPPARLVRRANAAWYLEEMDFGEEGRYPPLRDQNTDEDHYLAVLPPAGVADWASSPTSYQSGDRVKAQPAAWANGTSYRADAYVMQGGVMYRCKDDHTAVTATNKPPTGTNWQTFWAPLMATHRMFQCYRTHYSEAKYQPMIGTNWRDVWRITGPREGETVTVLSSKPLFETTHVKAGHVSAMFQAGHRRTMEDAETSFLVDDNYSGSHSRPVAIIGDWQFSTYQGAYFAFEGTVIIQRSEDGSAWQDFRRYDNPAGIGADAHAAYVNYTDSGTEKELVWFRLYQTGAIWTGAANNAKCIIRCGQALINGLLEITARTSPTQATMIVRRDFFDCIDTKWWHEGAWSDYRGYPAAAALHELRLVMAGNTAQPQTIWGSVSDDFHNFAYGTDDDEAWSYTLGSGDQNEIRGLVSQKALLVQTAGGEWVASTNSDLDPISPTNIRLHRHSNFGSAPIPGVVVDNAALFVQRAGLRLREYSYDFGQDSYTGIDLTLLAEHVSAGEIVQIAYQRNRDSILWAVTGAGELLGLTYERVEKVVGWHRHDTAGYFESVAVIYNDSNEDEVWVAVRRTIDGSTVRYIERLALGQWLAAENGVLTDICNVDCAVVQTELEGPLISSGLEHLEGCTVQVWADGAAHPDRVVTGGEILLEGTPNDVTIGLGYTSLVQTMPFDVTAGDGTTQARRKRIARARLRLRKTQTALLSAEPAGIQEPADLRRLDIDLMDTSPAGTTGDVTVQMPQGHAKQTTVTVAARGPCPLHLLAVFPEMNVTEH